MGAHRKLSRQQDQKADRTQKTNKMRSAKSHPHRRRAFIWRVASLWMCKFAASAATEGNESERAARAPPWPRMRGAERTHRIKRIMSTRHVRQQAPNGPWIRETNTRKREWKKHMSIKSSPLAAQPIDREAAIESPRRRVRIRAPVEHANISSALMKRYMLL